MIPGMTSTGLRSLFATKLIVAELIQRESNQASVVQVKRQHDDDRHYAALDALIAVV